MICLIALAVFGILAIFSARYRPLAKEAFSCVFRKLTLRKCETDLNTRLKSKIIGKVMNRSPPLARLTYKHFETLSWIFTLLMFGSMAYSAYSLYNFVQYGNCYGPETKPDEVCVFSLLQGETNSAFLNNYSGPIIYPSPGVNDAEYGPKDAKVQVIEFGCYACPYTRRVEPTVLQLLKHYNGSIHYVYRDFPISQSHSEADLHAEASHCALDQGKYWEYREQLLAMQDSCGAAVNGTAAIIGFAEQAGLNMTEFRSCFDSRKYKQTVIADFNDGTHSLRRYCSSD